MSKLYYLCFASISMMLLVACGSSNSSHPSDFTPLADLLSQHASLFENRASNTSSKDDGLDYARNDMENKIKALAIDYQGVTISSESTVEGVEIERPAEVTEISFVNNVSPTFSPGVRIELMLKLTFKKEMTRQELTGTDSPYRTPTFHVIAYKGNEVLDVLKPKIQKWEEPEKGYHETILTGTNVYLTLRIETSVLEPNKFDGLTRFDVVSENSEMLDML